MNPHRENTHTQRQRLDVQHTPLGHDKGVTAELVETIL